MSSSPALGEALDALGAQLFPVLGADSGSRGHRAGEHGRVDTVAGLIVGHELDEPVDRVQPDRRRREERQRPMPGREGNDKDIVTKIEMGLLVRDDRRTLVLAENLKKPC